MVNTRQRLAGVVLSLAICLRLGAEVIDLNGEPHAVTDAELAAGESFTNSAEGDPAVLTFSPAAAATYSGTISGNIRVVKSGSAKLTFAAANSYTGGTSISAGTLGITVGGALGLKQVEIAASSQLSLDAAIDCPNDISLTGASSSGKVQLYTSITSGTARFTGAVTSTGSLYPGWVSGGTLRFAGSGVTLGGDLFDDCGPKGAVAYFDCPVSCRYLKHNASNKGVFHFCSAGNKWTYAHSYTHHPVYKVAYACPSNSYHTSNQAGGDPKMTVYGDQWIRYIAAKSGSEASHSGQIAAASGYPSTVTLWSAADFMSQYVLTGPLSIVFAPTNETAVTWSILGGTSSMTGSFTVRNHGVVKMTNATFSAVASFSVKDSARLEIHSGTIITPTALTVDIDEDARLYLNEGRTMQVADFHYGTTRAKGGAYYQGPDGTNEGAIVIDQLEGPGCIYVPAREVETTFATWDGGGADTDIRTKENWEEDALPDLDEGGLVATFGSAGSLATVDADATFKGIVFNATEKPDGRTNDFAIVGEKTMNILSEGLVALAPSADEYYHYTLGAPLNLQAEQVWTLPSSGKTVLDVTAPISADSSKFGISLGGAATVNLRSSNTMAGGWTISNTTVYASADDAFGVTDVSDPHGVSVSKTGQIRLRGSHTYDKSFSLVSSAPNSGPYPTMLATQDGTTNCIKRAVSTSSGQYLQCGKNALLVLEGGLSCGGYFSLNGGAGSRVVVTNKSFNGGSVYIDSGVFELATTGNQTHWNNIASLRVLGGTLKTTVPHAFWIFTQYDANNGARTNLMLSDGTWDLCGGDQGICGVDSSNAKGEITSEDPAVLYLCQYKDHTLAAKVTGAAGISKRGTNTLTLNRTYETTGSLEVTEGNLVLGASCVWGGTNVCVNGATAVLKISANANLSKKSALTITGGGKVDLAVGVSLKVASLVIGDNPVPAGSVVDATSHPDAITGTGCIRVGGGGLILLCR